MEEPFLQPRRKVPEQASIRVSAHRQSPYGSGVKREKNEPPTIELKKAARLKETHRMSVRANKGLYVNRELSWLKFNERVLEEAEREDVPLCERLNFLSIYQSNLDEFFMVRVGALKERMPLSRGEIDSKTHMTAEEQIQAILKAVHRSDSRKLCVYTALLEQLERYGVKLIDFQKIGKEEKRLLEAYFDHEIAALLFPGIVGRSQPFPFLRNKEIYAAAVLVGKSGKEKIGIIPCGSNIFPRLIPVPMHEGEYMLSEELILHFIPKVFAKYRVKSKALIRITRSADIDADALYDEEADYREFMVKIIKQRRQLAPVRFELYGKMDEASAAALCRYAAVEPRFVFRSSMPLDLSFLYQIQDTLRQIPALFYPTYVPQRSSQLQSGKSILRQLRAGDKLLSYPYDSMRPFLDMLREAANDDAVISIKMTLYRLARPSKVVEALIEAAENGKEVLVLVELKARFDEENNIEWSRRLEKAGCHVIYGLDGYKVHCKLCLITRLEAGKAEYFTQIGTGNYNEKTARLYTDLSLLTADPEIGQNAAAVFRSLVFGEVLEESGAFFVAPKCLQNRILERIDEEIARAQAGEPAYIGLKINSLTDKVIIDRLIAASQAGVAVDMVVRGICCLLPGVEGFTDHIRVISIVGRFLEHSRIYLFGVGERQQIYISSADLMTRNTLRRVEVAAPIRDPALRRRLAVMFQTMLRDNCQAWELMPDGKYQRVSNEKAPVDSQSFFCRQAQEQANHVREELELKG